MELDKLVGLQQKKKGNKQVFVINNKIFKKNLRRVKTTWQRSSNKNRTRVEIP